MTYIPPHTHDFVIPTPTPEQAAEGLVDTVLATPLDVRRYMQSNYGNVDDTSDSQKAASGPIADAIANAFAGVTKATLNLGNVDNTSDADKPVSSAQAAALALKLTTSTALATVAGQTYSAVAAVPGYRSLSSRLLETYYAKDFGAIGDNNYHPVSEWIIPGVRGRFANLAALQVVYPHVTSTTDAIDWAGIQAALTRGAGQRIELGVGTFILNKTLIMAQNSVLNGSSRNKTIIKRTGDYGDTLQVGGEFPNAAYAYQIRNIWFMHGTTAAGALDAPITQESAHIRAFRSQGSIIEHCWFQRLTAAVIFEGGSWFRFDDNIVQGIWDAANPLAQEGVASVILRKKTGYNTPTSWFATKNQFGGFTVTRDYLYSSTTGGVTVSGGPVGIGSKYGILVEGSEDFLINDNYFGGPSVAHVAILPQAGSYIIDGVTADNFFDGCPQGYHILVDASGLGANGHCFTLNIHNNRCVNAQISMAVLKNSVSNTPSLYNLVMGGNQFKANVGTEVWLEGVCGGLVHDNIMTNYNCKNISPSDDKYVNAVLVNGVSSHVKVKDNLVGGGGNQFSAVGGAGNYCYKSITIDAAVAATCTQSGNENAGATAFPSQQITRSIEPLTDLAQNSGSPSKRFGQSYAGFFRFGSGSPQLSANTANPEGTTTATPGSIQARENATFGSALFIKETGTGNTGWAEVRDITYEVAATSLASIGLSVNTADKRKGKIVWDVTNRRSMRARGPLAADPWDCVDGSVTITPA